MRKDRGTETDPACSMQAGRWGCLLGSPQHPATQCATHRAPAFKAGAQYFRGRAFRRHTKNRLGQEVWPRQRRCAFSSRSPWTRTSSAPSDYTTLASGDVLAMPHRSGAVL